MYKKRFIIKKLAYVIWASPKLAAVWRRRSKETQLKSEGCVQEHFLLLKDAGCLFCSGLQWVG